MISEEYKNKLMEARRLSKLQASVRPKGTLRVTYGNPVVPLTIFVAPDEWRKHFERRESDWDYRFEYGAVPYI